MADILEIYFIQSSQAEKISLCEDGIK